MDIINVGQFKIFSGEVMVSDPCYEVGVWCQTIINNVKNGNWFGCVRKSDEGSWGIRNASLIIHHENSPLSDINNWKKEDAQIGVDSGQAGIYDIESFRNDRMINKVKNKIGLAIEKDGDKFYALNCDLTNEEIHAGTLENGVVSSSGFGDGGYELYTSKDKDGEIVAMEIVFI